MPVIQGIVLNQLLQSGEAQVEMPLGLKILGLRIVRGTVIVFGLFEVSTKITVTRKFTIVLSEQVYLEDLDYVGTVQFEDKKGVRFIHVMVEKDKPAVITGGA